MRQDGDWWKRQRNRGHLLMRFYLSFSVCFSICVYVWRSLTVYMYYKSVRTYVRCMYVCMYVYGSQKVGDIGIRKIIEN